jgi:hypothetical protein
VTARSSARDSGRGDSRAEQPAERRRRWVRDGQRHPPTRRIPVMIWGLMEMT